MNLLDIKRETLSRMLIADVRNLNKTKAVSLAESIDAAFERLDGSIAVGRPGHVLNLKSAEVENTKLDKTELTPNQIMELGKFVGLDVIARKEIDLNKTYTIHRGPIYDGDDEIYNGLMAFSLSDGESGGVLQLENDCLGWEKVNQVLIGIDVGIADKTVCADLETKNGHVHIVRCDEKNNKMDYAQASFEQASAPLIKWLAENVNPHYSAIVTSTEAELLSAEMVFPTNEFLKD